MPARHLFIAGNCDFPIGRDLLIKGKNEERPLDPRCKRGDLISERPLDPRCKRGDLIGDHATISFHWKARGRSPLWPYLRVVLTSCGGLDRRRRIGASNDGGGAARRALRR